MLPAYLPNPVAALFGGGTPIDRGRNWRDGRRILGNGKTYRGLAAGIIAGILVGLFQIMLAPNGWGLPVQTVSSVLLLAVGALAGDLVKSFAKRRTGRDQGESWLGFDQYDFVAGSFIFLLIGDPAWFFTWVTLPVFITILILSPLLHRAVNIIGYLAGIKKVPW
ncbi:MAG: CDP-2,3-bis-(O-geranylgeranyl)-sn-glycerol synthase [Methanomicrobiales archaeon]|nr:CDP-2,3-bis-(O-geranylgeranyl)-sn-glycerol synthase [Methanomicrobiales archaeon]